MAAIIVEYPRNELLKRHIHTLHQIDLYHGYLYERISAVEYESNDEFEEMLGKSYSNWAAEELFRLGIVSIYHFWEKSIVSLLKEQAARQAIQLPKDRGLSVVKWVRGTLEECFVPLDNDRVWDGLDELRAVANTIKHGNADKYKDLSRLHRQYFMMTEHDRFDDAEEYENRFFIDIDRFRCVVSNAAEFWDDLPHEVAYGR